MLLKALQLKKRLKLTIILGSGKNDLMTGFKIGAGWKILLRLRLKTPATVVRYVLLRQGSSSMWVLFKLTKKTGETDINDQRSHNKFWENTVSI